VSLVSPLRPSAGQQVSGAHFWTVQVSNDQVFT